jgi:hypothetical protein
MKSLLAFLVLLSCCFLCLVAAAQRGSSVSDRRPSPTQRKTTEEIMDGERLFHTNCGRCHNPPEDLSPREARAVVRQMRVRAMLSEQDEKRLLKFLAP